MAARILAVVSDLHVGHRVGLWPEELETREGGVIKASGAQRVLLEYWEDFWSSEEAKEADTVLLVGDLTEGPNSLEGGAGLMTPQLGEQVRAAAGLLAPYVKGKRTLTFLGSKYHSGDNWETDAAVAETLGAEDQGVVANLELEGTGKVLNISHTAGDAMIYKATAVDRDSLFADAVEGVKLPFHIDLYIRAHWHWYHFQQNESRSLLLLPCWKFWHPIRRRGGKGYFKYQPSIGACVVRVDEHVTVKPYLYPIMQVYDALREV